MSSSPAHDDHRVARRIVAGRSALLRWYRRHRRDLPWRRTRDPYAIWVSEVMLQQTRVDVVVPYFERFVARFPDPRALAAADVEQVLAAWSGLGYYRRARALHAGVRIVVDRHDGRVPDDPAALLRLPGIGRYTAGAIASIAFGRPEPVLDGNVRRVLSRLMGRDAGDPGKGDERAAARDRRLWSLAAAIARGPSPGDLNQALMELGAVVCRPIDPDCGACPVRSRCDAFASGTPNAWPAPRRRRPIRTVRVAVAVVRRGRRTLFERPGPDSPLRGTWDLPAFELAPDSDPASPVVAELYRKYGMALRAEPVTRRLSHGILDRRLLLEVVPARHTRGTTSRRRDLRWVEPSEIDDVAISGASRKVLASLFCDDAPR